MSVIDIHTHMFGNAWLDMLKKHATPTYDCQRLADQRDYLMEKGAPACAFEPEAFDYGLRIEAQDKLGIDIGIVSLTSPNVFWGAAEISAETARLVNDEMAAGQTAYPDRIRFFASIPWEYPDLALIELKRALANGAVGVMVLAHINDRHLIDPLFAPIWRALDDLALPVLVHPTAPFGAKEAGFGFERILMPGLGFMFDTTLGIARMAVDGFFDRFPNVKLIVSHAGGYLPYVASRIDVFREAETLMQFKITESVREILGRLYYDAIVYDAIGLDLCIDLAGPDKVMFGTDFPMPYNIGKLNANIDRLPPDQAAAIKGGNARRLFNL